jgi:predicted RNA-binding protein YlxR (DUF448 family)
MSNKQEWKWKRWDVRSDGKVFWEHTRRWKGREYWVTWDKALKLQESNLKSRRKYQKTQKHRDYQTEYQKVYQKTSKYKKNKNIYQKIKRESNPVLAMAGRVRRRITHAICNKGYSKTSKTSEMLGCDWGHLMTYLASKFVDGMSWDNRHLWHIDHIIPLASATSEEELIKLNYYTNLQPLWAADNLRKSDKILSQL